MKRTRVILIIIALLAVIAGVITLVPDGQPSYQGRKLAAWVDKMQENGPGSPDWLAGSNAVHQIGTNAIPLLLKWYQAKDSKLWAGIVSNWNQRADYEWRIRSGEERHMMAWFAFGALGENSRPVWPLFIKWTYDKDPEVRLRGITLLRGCRADKSVFLPTAGRLLKDPELQIQVLTAQYFRDLYPAEAEAAGVFNSSPQLKSPPPNAAVTNQPAAK